jgi:hypothetical protein
MTAPSTEESPWNVMGVFAPIFDGGHYLTFLNLNPPFNAAVEALRTIVESGAPTLEADVVAVLDPALAGWRPQLVGAAAMLLGATTPTTLAALWRALEQPSWVSPQLAVTAFLRAPDFEARARARIEVLCQVDASAIRARRGREVPDSNDDKQLAALIALLKERGPPDWLAPLEASQSVRDILAASHDDGAHHALRWLGRVRSFMNGPA